MHVLHHQSPTALCEGLVEELAGGSPSNTLTLRRHSADLIFGSSMRVLAAMKVARVPIPFNLNSGPTPWLLDSAATQLDEQQVAAPRTPSKLECIARTLYPPPEKTQALKSTPLTLSEVCPARGPKKRTSSRREQACRRPLEPALTAAPTSNLADGPSRVIFETVA